MKPDKNQQTKPARNASPDWRPTASRYALERRARLLHDIRSFFAERDVLEVETPVLSSAGNTDPNIQSLKTDEWQPRYLRTSPEFPMKRLLAAGVGDIYELGRVFRAGERGSSHNPEFTMLEWYRLHTGYLELADEVIDLIRHCGRGQFDHWPVRHFSYRDLFVDLTGVDPILGQEIDCETVALERGIQAGPMSMPDWLDLLLTHIIQPGLDHEQVTVIHDFPPEQAALARIRPQQGPGSHAVAERFEVYLGPVELANGYHELAAAAEQRDRFERDNRHRLRQNLGPLPVDERMLAALQQGLPDCSGVALGVDRLLMSILDLGHIDSVMAFPAGRA